MTSWVAPPEGWYTLGAFAWDDYVEVEFSEELGEDGLPLWERPTGKRFAS